MCPDDRGIRRMLVEGQRGRNPGEHQVPRHKQRHAPHLRVERRRSPGLLGGLRTEPAVRDGVHPPKRPDQHGRRRHHSPGLPRPADRHVADGPGKGQKPGALVGDVRPQAFRKGTTRGGPTKARPSSFIRTDEKLESRDRDRLVFVQPIQKTQQRRCRRRARQTNHGTGHTGMDPEET